MNNEAKPKRSELKVEGDSSVKAVLTIEKFMPQMRDIPISIASMNEKFNFDETWEPFMVICSPVQDLTHNRILSLS